MIKIIYVADPEGGKLTMRAEGHAGYAPAGQDIVCAAVSCLMQTLAYSAAEDERTSSCIYQGKEGPVVSVEAGDSVLMRDKFELVADGLDLLAEQYPENVNFKKRCKCSPAVDLQLFAATATTAACGRNKEEPLGLRPAGCECRLRHEADTGSRNPNIFSGNFIFIITEEQRLRPLLFCFFTGGGVMKTPCCPLHLFP